MREITLEQLWLGLISMYEAGGQQFFQTSVNSTRIVAPKAVFDMFLQVKQPFIRVCPLKCLPAQLKPLGKGSRKTAVLGDIQNNSL